MNDPGPALADIQREWPRWHTWQGVAGLLYASRRKTSPPAVLRAGDPADLRDQIKRWESQHEGGR